MVVSLSTYTDNIYRGKMLLDIEGVRDHAEQLKSSGEAIGGRVEAYSLYVKPPKYAVWCDGIRVRGLSISG